MSKSSKTYIITINEFTSLKKVMNSTFGQRYNSLCIYRVIRAAAF